MSIKCGYVESIREDIAKKTDINNHTGAVMVLAQYVGSLKYTRIIKALMQIQDEIGHMPSSLISFRSEVLSELLDLVGTFKGQDIKEYLKGAF